jgi:hypothetical protein
VGIEKREFECSLELCPNNGAVFVLVPQVFSEAMILQIGFTPNRATQVTFYFQINFLTMEVVTTKHL